MMRAIVALPIDHQVGPTGWRGGGQAARGRLDAFLDSGLDRYGEERNDPDSEASSGLSGWLHYGHLSVHEVFDAVARREGWSPARITPPADGRRSGWWGMSTSSESFIDEVVTWRELGFGYCAHQKDYRNYRTLPEWPRVTLERCHGGIRSMSSDSTRRKVALDRYLERWGPQRTLLW